MAKTLRPFSSAKHRRLVFRSWLAMGSRRDHSVNCFHRLWCFFYMFFTCFLHPVGCCRLSKPISGHATAAPLGRLAVHFLMLEHPLQSLPRDNCVRTLSDEKWWKKWWDRGISQSLTRFQTQDLSVWAPAKKVIYGYLGLNVFAVCIQCYTDLYCKPPIQQATRGNSDC